LTGLSRSDASKIFNLLGDKTKVEWGRLESRNANGSTDFFVGTSHEEGSEGAISRLIYTLPEGSVQRYDHSHGRLHRYDVDGYRYSRDDETFWNRMNTLHPNASAGIHFQKQYDLYYRNGEKTEKYYDPLYRYK
jgi:hypothetical protein